jgi:hypothetical protein
MRKVKTSYPLPGIRLLRPALGGKQFVEVESYLLELKAQLGEDIIRESTNITWWFPKDQTPRNPIENAIHTLRLLIKPPDEFAGNDWWINFLPKNGASLNPHFDRDVAILAKENRYVNPIYGSILYFSNFGSPTAFFDYRPTDYAKGKDWTKVRRACVYPNKNQYAIFKGNLFHGVFPLQEGEKANDGERITIAVGWWNYRPAPPFCSDLEKDLATGYRQILSEIKDLKNKKTA